MKEQKVVLVTGCAKGGIGYEYCLAFAGKGCRVYASDIAVRVHEIAGLPENVSKLEMDVTSDDSVTNGISGILADSGRIDIVINNAGIGCTGPLAEVPLDQLSKVWEVNVLGQIRVAQAVVPHMVAQGSGTIANIGSVVGWAPTPWAGGYCASKAAVHAFTEVLRAELKPLGMHVVLVVPGAVRSGLGKANTEELGKQHWRLYAKYEEAIAERARASQGSKATDAAVFARHVARRVLGVRPPPKQIVFGHMTGLFTMLAWSPRWARDLFFAKRFGLK
ncbi:hypothetical protein AMTRI_Chr12g238800 [Amborella trichopoda]|uniref:Uncharacterized protein n=1 Tax=Amborella trichopoda TaxID=13333 RepID=U5D7W8_AMBTC|nr:uncharacterized protein LOC18446905 [Amborella trichopoda]ERN18539.1 hypothetical protein AMTR_s00065p00079070 [Amborella trichopoda]|eukprot:XP_006857072.1 uncharacterized protein LOC18446905 [Amborella trichopoda]